MSSPLTKQLSAASLLLALSHSVSAMLVIESSSPPVSTPITTYHYLQHPDLVGQMAGPDLLWGTSDDFSTITIGPDTFGPFNTLGAASGFLDSLGTFGSFGGSFEVNGTTIQNGNFFGEFSNLNPIPDINVPISYTGASGNLTVNMGSNTATSSYSASISSSSFPVPLQYDAVGNYSFISNGDDYHAIFAGNADVISQFDFLFSNNLIPSNFDTLFIGRESYEFTGALFNGVTGNQGVVFYSNVPVPAAWILFASSGLMMGFCRRRTA